MNAPSDNPSPLERLARRSEGLLDDLDHAREDVLSVGELNRTLKQVLRNQVAIMRALAQGEQSQAPLAQPVNGARVNGARGVVVRRKHVNGASHVNGDGLPDEDEGFTKQTGATGVDPEERAQIGVGALRAHEVEDEPETQDDAEAADEAESIAQRVLGVTKTVSQLMARQIVSDFDHRENDFEKGLDKLQRWTEGESGTPFQLRGNRAYLNLSRKATDEGVQNYEKNLMQRMGFGRRLGRLQVPGLSGEVVVYERT